MIEYIVCKYIVHKCIERYLGRNNDQVIVQQIVRLTSLLYLKVHL